MLFSTTDGAPAGGIATMDLHPERFASLKRLAPDPEVAQPVAHMFTLATGDISMIVKN